MAIDKKIGGLILTVSRDLRDLGFFETRRTRFQICRCVGNLYARRKSRSASGWGTRSILVQAPRRFAHTKMAKINKIQQSLTGRTRR
jgi:hypothetical protein